MYTLGVLAVWALAWVGAIKTAAVATALINRPLGGPPLGHT